jgi:hypothetical protein
VVDLAQRGVRRMIQKRLPARRAQQAMAMEAGMRTLNARTASTKEGSRGQTTIDEVRATSTLPPE